MPFNLNKRFDLTNKFVYAAFSALLHTLLRGYHVGPTWSPHGTLCGWVHSTSFRAFEGCRKFVEIRQAAYYPMGSKERFLETNTRDLSSLTHSPPPRLLLTFPIFYPSLFLSPSSPLLPFLPTLLYMPESTLTSILPRSPPPPFSSPQC